MTIDDKGGGGVKVLLNRFLVFVLNYLSYDFKHFCKNVLILIRYVLFHITLKFERASTILDYGRVTKDTRNSRE